MVRNIMVFGTKLVYPRGLRKSPGSNELSRCVGAELRGKTGGGRSAQRNRLSDAAKRCGQKI